MTYSGNELEFHRGFDLALHVFAFIGSFTVLSGSIWFISSTISNYLTLQYQVAWSIQNIDLLVQNLDGLVAAFNELDANVATIKEALNALKV